MEVFKRLFLFYMSFYICCFSSIYAARVKLVEVVDHDHHASAAGLMSSSKVSTADAVVAQDGSGKYRTVQEAVNDAPELLNGSSRYVIYIKAGKYRENVVVRAGKRNLTLTGDGMGKTILSSDKCATSDIDSAGALVVEGDGFLAMDITFENTATCDAQRVAMACASDRSAFFRCEFRGFQDTLYAKEKRQFYKECDIYGTIDFIFGDAAAVFQDCNIRVRKPSENHPQVVITAQGKTDQASKTGIVLHRCNIAAAEDLGKVKTYLGRPWKQFSTTVVMQCSIDKLIDPSGWLQWAGHPEYDRTVTYREFGNQGPGADTRDRVKWQGYQVITARGEAEQYTVASFIDGVQWLPSLGVPFTPGLLDIAA